VINIHPNFHTNLLYLTKSLLAIPSAQIISQQNILLKFQKSTVNLG